MDYFERKGNIGILYLRKKSDLKHSSEHALRGFSDKAKELVEDGIRNIVLDFEDIPRFISDDATEIMLAYEEVLKVTGTKLYLCNLEKSPKKIATAVGIANLLGIEIRGSIDETVAELEAASETPQ